MTTDSSCRVEVDGRIAHLVLDRPPVNALNVAFYEELIESLGDLSRRADICVVLLRSGHDGIFSAGADIKELRTVVDAGDRDADERRQHFARSAYDTLMNLNKPTIAVVNGPAIGGGAVLAACCDLRIGSARTTFHLPEVNIVRCGGARHYMRLLPQGVLRQMYFTGRPLTAHDSHRFGLLNDVVEQGEELHRALELAEEIATKSPLALRTAKEALNAIEELSVLDGYALEQSYSVALGRSADAKEAAAAFLEKRPPAWTGV